MTPSTPQEEPSASPGLSTPGLLLPDLLALPALDPAQLSELRSIEIPGEPSVLAQLLQLFFTQTPPIFSALRAAIDSADARAIRAQAHKLSGSCSNFGGLRVSRVCDHLERLVLNEQLEAIPSIVPWLEHFYKELSSLLQGELDALPPA